MKGRIRVIASIVTALGVMSFTGCSMSPSTQSQALAETATLEPFRDAALNFTTPVQPGEADLIRISSAPAEATVLSVPVARADEPGHFSGSADGFRTETITSQEADWSVAPQAVRSLRVRQADTPSAVRDIVDARIEADAVFGATGAQTGLGVDVAIAPRASVLETSTFRSTRAGAEVRVGQGLDLRGQDVDQPSWYIFAGADGEAVVWDVAGQGLNVMGGGVTLQDKVTMGEMQAGLAFEQAGTQIAVSYLRREFDYENGSIRRSTEGDFAAVTLTWRH